MALTKAQLSIWEKARALGGSEQGVPLTDARCCYLLARIAEDLGQLARFPEFRQPIRDFFTTSPCSALQIDGVPPHPLYERLLSFDANADTYFSCLASLLKARLKYERILQTQPLPTFEQVGPRGLLQFGSIGSQGLAGLLQWRKWFFDIDNRAGQETGYLFEPIIAHALGGTAAPSSKSPVRRSGDESKGRQVDCILERPIRDGRTERCAYEFKIRVTIAASGQGRWAEELQFPIDCRDSGFRPILVCMDATPNPKLTELVNAFRRAGGETYVGEPAWQHLRAAAGPTMARFLEHYVQVPMQEILNQAASTPHELRARWGANQIEVAIGAERFSIDRDQPMETEDGADPVPNDVDGL